MANEVTRRTLLSATDALPAMRFACAEVRQLIILCRTGGAAS